MLSAIIAKAEQMKYVRKPASRKAAKDCRGRAAARGEEFLSVKSYLSSDQKTLSPIVKLGVSLACF